jgi:GT2 family glycosyltransferase
MTELLRAISSATAAAGHTTELALDEFPRLEGEYAYVVIPHEFHAWGDPRGFPNRRLRARTIALCTENPGTEWFEATSQLVPEFAAAVSINRSSAAELQRRGIRCEHLQLGYSAQWDSWLGDEDARRDIDVLYLGAADPRRDPLLGSLGGELWARQCEFLVPPLEPRTRPRPDFLKGTDKYHRLRSARTLLNLHRTTSSALEWMRFLEAICNGCVVVSEPCLDCDPLVPGEHFIAASVDSIGHAIDVLLDSPDRLRLLRERAYDFVRTELPMEPAGERLAELAAELPREPLAGDGSSLRAKTERLARPALPSRAEIPPSDAPNLQEPHPATEAIPPSTNPIEAPCNTPERRRTFRSISNRILTGRAGVRVLDQTPSYASTEPRVTVVLVTVDDRGREAVEALASVAKSRYDTLEVLILDDSSDMQTAAAVRAFLDDHPSLPAMLLRQPVNHGLAHSRNTLVKHARGEYVFILDATGGIYPSTLERLVTSLDADPHAIFAYPMVAVFEGDRPVELLSSLPWEPARLKSENWIDATALIRRARLLELGGYSTDQRLAGWEDFDLWCKCAEAGGHGVHVPQVLAWHRRIPASVTQSESETPAKWAVMRERFPQLFAQTGGG